MMNRWRVRRAARLAARGGGRGVSADPGPVRVS